MSDGACERARATWERSESELRRVACWERREDARAPAAQPHAPAPGRVAENELAWRRESILLKCARVRTAWWSVLLGVVQARPPMPRVVAGGGGGAPSGLPGNLAELRSPRAHSVLRRLLIPSHGAAPHDCSLPVRADGEWLLDPDVGTPLAAQKRSTPSRLTGTSAHERASFLPLNCCPLHCRCLHSPGRRGLRLRRCA